MARENTPCLDADTETWHYPTTDDVFEEVGLYCIDHYIQVRSPIFSMCRGAGWPRGSSPRQFRWDQPMDLELAKASASKDASVADSDK